MSALSFLAPIALAGLLALPLLWRLLRVTPPRPREIAFPPTKLILDVEPKEEQPARTPLWLLIMRMVAAAALIFAVAGPIWNSQPTAPGGKGPLLIVLDDGWAAAGDWDERMRYAQARIAAAGRDGRAAAVMAVSDGGRAVAPADATQAAERLAALKPQPRKLDRAAALPAISAFLRARPDADLVWITDGVAQGASDADPKAFGAALAALPHGAFEVATSQGGAARGLAGADNAPQGLTVRVLRATTRGQDHGLVRALDLRGAVLGEAMFNFQGGLETTATIDLPLEIRNDVARLDVIGEASAGAVALLDDRWKRRRVAIIAETTAETAQPLLSAGYYLSRALGPFADAREKKGDPSSAIVQALTERPAVIALADVGVVSPEAHDKLRDFVEEGGVLVRFAGPRLAAASDDLIPVRLRRGGRTLGGALSWDQPKALAPFSRESPFSGLTPPAEVTATRQVLAEPEPGLPQKTWATLADGTPLVTAERRGKGVIALFHVTADTTWSNLPLSGLFVDMLRRVVAQATQAGGEGDTAGAGEQATDRPVAAPTRILDGFGVFTSPPATARPIPASYNGEASADHPPGFYGPPEALVAVNVLSPGETLAPLDLAGLPARQATLTAPEPVDLRAPLLILALALLAADALAAAWLSGALRLPGLRGGAAKAAALALAVVGLAAILPGDGYAQNSPRFGAPPMFGGGFNRRVLPPESTDPALTTRLAYVLTGDARTDEASRLGLSAVSRALRERTSLNPGEPMGVDPGKDDLAFYPLLYWPVVAGRPQPPQAVKSALGAYMKNGGTVLFDTRDALMQRPGAQTPEGLWLKGLLTGVDVPELEPVPRDHVVTKTFYLLDGLVGRTTVGQTWLEALPPPPADGGPAPARAGDSVSPIVITSNDFAGAWAETSTGEPMFPLVPGGRRQREMALRGGVNIVMYTLTGNYKADQVHVRDLLERLDR